MVVEWTNKGSIHLSSSITKAAISPSCKVGIITLLVAKNKTVIIKLQEHPQDQAKNLQKRNQGLSEETKQRASNQTMS